ncbi:MAG: DUF2141 domain-containing protein [Pseudomonadota bacterium]
MKHPQSIAALVAAAFLQTAAIAETVDITVENIEVQSGTLHIGLYDAETYDGGNAVNGAQVTVVGNTVSVSLQDITPGEYGVKIFHDEDNDGEMDTNPFGLPTEAYAFSNNAKGRFGPAKWEDAKFVVSEAGTAQIISLN